MGQNESAFEARVDRIERSYEMRTANGVRHEILSDGLIVARPRRRAPRFPWKGLAISGVALVGFKVLMLMNLGPNVYAQRVDMLADGTVFERAGAWFMQVDVVTKWTADNLTALIKTALR